MYHQINVLYIIKEGKGADYGALYFFRPLGTNGATISFQSEKAPPKGSSQPARPFGPGCSHVYCSKKLLDFLKATHVRIHFDGHPLVQNAAHRYFGMYRVIVVGWWVLFSFCFVDPKELFQKQTNKKEKLTYLGG